jgi:predicted dehydrogenase
MAPPRVLVLGAGSIGARHARNLREAGADVDVADPQPGRSAGIAGTRSVPFDLDRLDGYDGIVVASPTIFHVEQATRALQAGAYVMVEKPLAMASSELGDLLDSAGNRVMVGYNLRLHEPVERVMRLVHDGRAGTVSAVRLWFGSWLPDWRPAVDYRTTYSARSDLGGGVLLDAIHELDMLVWLVGDHPMEVVGAVVARVGPLDIDVEDTVKALLRTNVGVMVELSLDYLSRRYRRGIEVVGDRATLRLDWARRVVEIEDASGIAAMPADVPVPVSYERQAERFLQFLAGTADAPVDAGTGAASVRLAEQIRLAAQ